MTSYKVRLNRREQSVEAASADEALMLVAGVGQEGYVFEDLDGVWVGMRGSRGLSSVAWAAGRYELHGDVVERTS